MLAITGATGHLGQATLHFLLQRVAPTNLVAIVRDPQKAANLSELGVQVRQGDYNDPASLFDALDAVTTLFTHLRQRTRRCGSHAATQKRD